MVVSYLEMKWTGNRLNILKTYHHQWNLILLQPTIGKGVRKYTFGTGVVLHISHRCSFTPFRVLLLLQAVYTFIDVELHLSVCECSILYKTWLLPISISLAAFRVARCPVLNRTVRFRVDLSGWNFQLEPDTDIQIHMYKVSNPQCLAPARSLEFGQECPVFRRADLAPLAAFLMILGAFLCKALSVSAYTVKTVFQC